MKVVSRESWGALNGSNLSTNITPQYGGVAIHYVGGKGNLIGIPHGKCTNVVRKIQNDHINTNRWADIAYTFLVCCHGYVYVGRGIGKRTAANGTIFGNQNFYAICGLINKDEVPTKEMIQGIKDACQYLRTKGKAGDKVVGHKNLKNTDCPGPLYKFVQSGKFQREKIRENNSFPGVLKVGSTGGSVKKLQIRLNRFGHDLRDDGIFGPKTKLAVEKYQTFYGLRRTGIVYQETWDSLF